MNFYSDAKTEQLNHIFKELEALNEEQHCIIRTNGCIWSGTVFISEEQKNSEAPKKNERDENWFSDFAARCCTAGNGYTVSAAMLYGAYLAFCNINGIKSRDTAAFLAELVKRGFKITEAPDPQSPRIVISGLKIKT